MNKSCLILNINLNNLINNSPFPYKVPFKYLQRFFFLTPIQTQPGHSHTGRLLIETHRKIDIAVVGVASANCCDPETCLSGGVFEEGLELKEK